jgi:hypothetical protein
MRSGQATRRDYSEGMKTFKPYDPDQLFLLPPAPRDWLPEGLCSANIVAISRRQLLKSVLMVEPTEDRSRHDTRVTREAVADDRGHW